MKRLNFIAIIAVFFIPATLLADPMDSAVIYTDMTLDRCLETAAEALSSADLVDISTEDNLVQGNDKKKRYFASVRCENDHGIILFTVSGPNDAKRAELMQAVYQEDDDVTGSNCVIQPDSSNSLWVNCDQQEVTILGKVASMVMQHPILSFDLGESEGNHIARTIQSYMDVGDHQIILLAKTDINCTNDMQVTGTLEHIDLGGKEGTRQSYQGWSVHVKEFMCF